MLNLGMAWLQKWVPLLAGFGLGLMAPSMFGLGAIIAGVSGDFLSQFGNGAVDLNELVAAGLYLGVASVGLSHSSMLWSVLGGFGIGAAVAHILVATGKTSVFGLTITT